MLSLSEVTLICENRQKYAHFESLICEKNLALGGSAIHENGFTRPHALRKLQLDLNQY